MSHLTLSVTEGQLWVRVLVIICVHTNVNGAPGVNTSYGHVHS